MRIGRTTPDRWLSLMPLTPARGDPAVGRFLVLSLIPSINENNRNSVVGLHIFFDKLDAILNWLLHYRSADCGCIFIDRAMSRKILSCLETTVTVKTAARCSHPCVCRNRGHPKRLRYIEAVSTMQSKSLELLSLVRQCSHLLGGRGAARPVSVRAR